MVSRHDDAIRPAGSGCTPRRPGRAALGVERSFMSAADDLITLCARALSRAPSTEAILYEGRWWDWGAMRRTADQLAQLIAASGADRAAPVAFVARSRPSAIAALLGLIADRRTVRMIYAFQSPTAIARDIARLEPAVVVAAPEDMTAEVRAVLADKGIAAISIGDAETAAVAGFERARTRPPAEPQGDPRIEILTSGTTGTPKPFAVTYEMIGAHLVRAGDALANPDDRADEPPALLYFPLGNISGLYTTLPSLLRGQRAVLLDRFSIEAWRDYVVRFRPAHSGFPPASVQMMLDADIPAEDLASIKTMGFGAAPLDPTVHRAFEARYGIPVLLSYGATEFGGPVVMMTAELHAKYGQAKFGSVGQPFGGAQMRIVDPETGEVLPAGREGLLEIISPRIGPDWIHTADIGIIDEDGFLFLRGRADGAIVRGGFKILPETVERALLLHPAVTAACVVALADRRLGQTPGAAIQRSPSSEAPTSAALEAHLREHLPATHIPVAWRFVDELPKNPSMKIDRPAVARLFEQPAAQPL